MDTSALSSALRNFVASLHKGLRKHMSATGDYSMTELETIGHLSRSLQLLPTELAALAKVKTQSMSNILNKLEQQGVVKRKPSMDDGRKVYISLTAVGKKMVDRAVYERDEWLKGIIEESLTAKEIELLIKALPVLDKLADAK